MRIHDINVVADPNRHAPAGPDPVVADGTIGGIAAPKDENEQEFDAQIAAQNYIKGNWTGPWPVYHIYIVSIDAGLLAHVTVDILGSISLLQIGFLEWFFSLFGLQYDSFEYWLGIIDLGIGSIAISSITIFFEAMIAAMMVFDYTKALPALAIGVSLWLLTAALWSALSWHFAYNLENPITAGWMWLYMFCICLGNLVGGYAISGYTGYMRVISKSIFGWLAAHGVKGMYAGKRLTFALASILSIIAMMGLSVFWIIYYSNAA